MPPPWEATVSPVAAAPEPTAAVEPAVTPAAAAQAPPALTVTPSAAAPVSPPLPAPTPPAFATPAVAPLSLPTSAQAPAEPAGIATSLTVPPLEAAGAGEGGEWDLLVGKVRAWVEAAGFQGRWESLGVPLRSLGLLLAAVVILRIYGALLETLGDLPLLPRLLQLVGLFAFGQFCLTRLVRSSDRERILRTWRDNWKDFSGRG